MKLQGVQILRISDMRKFFNLEEFWRCKNEFIELLSLRGVDVVCDTDSERALCSIVRTWLTDAPLTASFNSDNLMVNIGGIKENIPLNRLAKIVDRYRESMRTTDRVGLTALYILVGADKHDCDIEPQYDLLAALKSGKFVGNFLPIFDNHNFTVAIKHSTSYEHRIIANINAGRPLMVSVGSQSITLDNGECVVGIFHNDECVKLLPRQLSDLSQGLSVRLMENSSSKHANAEIHTPDGIRIVEGVSSIWIEPGAGVAYTTFDGQVHFNEKKCYSLKRRIDSFRKNRPNEKILAIEITECGDYIIYTTNIINY